MTTLEVGHPIEGQSTPCVRTPCPLDDHLSVTPSRSGDFRPVTSLYQFGKVVALLIVRGNLTAGGGGGGRYLSDHDIGQILTVLDSFSSSVSSVSVPVQHRMLTAVPIYCKRASSTSSLASMDLLAVHRQQTSLA